RRCRSIRTATQSASGLTTRPSSTSSGAPRSPGTTHWTDRMATIATSACWVLVIGTWIVAALYWRRKSHWTRQGRPPWVAVLVVAAIVVARLTWHDARHLTDHSLWLELPGLVLLVASTVFTIWARLRLGRMWSSSPSMLQADHELRTDGPYAITRHPIYTGL